MEYNSRSIIPNANPHAESNISLDAYLILLIWNVRN